MKALATKAQSSAGPVRKRVRRVVSPMRAGQRVQRAEIRNILRQPVPQAKLPIGPSGDKYEREADAVAERVLRMPEPPGGGETDEREEEHGERSVRRDASDESAEAPEEEAPEPEVQRTMSAGEDAEPEPEAVEEQVQRQAIEESAADEGSEEPDRAPELESDEAGEAASATSGAEGQAESSDTPALQLKSNGDIGPHVSRPDVAARITSPGSGRALPNRVRGFMEPRMGYRFAHVRLHDTVRDQTDAASLRARAFTYRNHIWLGKGQSVDDRRLMAHELAHVVQQRAAVQRKALVEAEPEVQATEPETEKKGFFSGLKTLAGGLVEKAKDLGGKAKQALLEKLAVWAHKIPGFHLLTVLLGRNPVTGKAVERTPVTLIGAFLRLVPRGEQLFENLQRSGAIERTFAWLNDQIARLDLTWNTIKALFQQFFASLSVTDIANPPGVFEKLKRIFGPPLVRIRNFAVAVGRKVLEFIFAGVLSLAGGYGEKIMAVIRKAGDVFHLIVSDPIGFLKNLLKAVKLGFMQFMGNIWTHLKTGLLGWLFGALQNAGLKLPEKLDLKGILSIVLQVLGLTYAYLRKKLVKLIGEKRVRFLEKAFEFVKILVTKGLMGIWNKLLEYVGSLWDKVIGTIRNWVVTKIIQGAITKLATMFNPVGAIIQAIMTVYNTIQFFMERANQIMALANAIFDSIANIALGKLTAAANYVENTMARTVPIIISFLARLIGLGGISDRIKTIIGAIQAQVDKGVDKVVGFIVKKAKALFGKMKAFGKKVVGKVVQWWRAKRNFKAGGERHSLYFERSGTNARLMVASSPQPYREFVNGIDTANDSAKQQAKTQALNIADQLDQAIANANSASPSSSATVDSSQTQADDPAITINNLLSQLAAATAPLMDTPLTAVGAAVTAFIGSGRSLDEFSTRLQDRTQTPDFSQYYSINGLDRVVRRRGVTAEVPKLRNYNGLLRLDDNQPVAHWEEELSYSGGRRASGWLGAITGGSTNPSCSGPFFGLDAQGHLIGAQFGGANGCKNMSRMQRLTNSPKYTKFENPLKTAMVENSIRVHMVVNAEGNFSGQNRQWHAAFASSSARNAVMVYRNQPTLAAAAGFWNPADLTTYLANRPERFSIAITGFQEMINDNGTPIGQDIPGAENENYRGSMSNPIEEDNNSNELASLSSGVIGRIEQLREERN